MEVSEAVRVRRSVRAYEPTPVPEDVIERVLDAGRVAPSANNRQPWHFIVVTDSARREALSEGKYAKFLTQCPVVIVGCGDADAAPKWAVVDTTIALHQMVLAATAEGLGTCWIGSFDEERVKGLLKVPDNMRVVAMLALGYAKRGQAQRAGEARNRKPIEEITSSEEYGRRRGHP